MPTSSAERSDLSGMLPGLAAVPVVGILRRCPAHLAAEAAGAAGAAGIRVVEVTFDSSDPLRQVERLVELGTLTVGVGTVTDSAQVAAAVDAGAAFVVSPVVDLDVIEAAADLGVPAIPGAATPTEILTALRAGAAAVKVFPASLLGGPAYLRAIRSPLGTPPLVPTGGIEPETARAYLDAGALAVGAGSSLFPAEALAGGDLATLRARAEAWVRAVS